MLRLSLMLIMMSVSASSLANPTGSLQKVGSAKLEVFFWDIYHSTLYSQDGKYQPGRYPLALQIRYLRDIKASDLIERTEEEWQELGIAKQVYVNWLPKLEKIWPDIQDGDELLLHVSEQKHSTFYFNQQVIGEIDDPMFGPTFLAIWLDENCSYPKLRRRLIGE